MKKRFYVPVLSWLLSAFLLVGMQANAQSVTLKPNAAVGEDADILTTYGCTPSGAGSPAELVNWDTYDLTYQDWTISALGCGRVSGQFLLRFTEMNNLPCNAIITRAELRLYGVSSSGFVPQGNSSYPGSPFPTNPGWIERVTSGWAESSVTWNSMPSTTVVNQTPLRSTISQWNDNFVVNVTALTQDIVASGANDGYMLRLQTASRYRSAVFASSDDGNASLWPELYLEYTIPYCNANFNYCSNTLNPNTYVFSANDPGQCLNYVWDFGDGTTGYGPNVVHTYAGPGYYVVCLKLVDNLGVVHCTECTPICINQVPHLSDPGVGVADPGDIIGGKASVPKSLVSNNQSSRKVARGENLYLSDGSITILSVNPNPAHANIDINFRLVKGSSVQYKVYNIEGKEVLGDKKAMNEGDQKLSVSVEGLSPGVYILEMKDDYSTAKYKFTKN